MGARVSSFFLILATSISLFSVGSADAQQQFSLSDRIEVVDGPLNVREGPDIAHKILGQQTTGAMGTVADASPHYAGGIWWWFVDFDEGVDGWVAEGLEGVPYIAGRSAQGAVAEAEGQGIDEPKTEVVSERQAAPPPAVVPEVARFDAVWEGMVFRDSGRNSLAYPMEIRLNAVQEPEALVGEVHYGSSGCEYSLRLSSLAGSTMSATRITSAECGGDVIFNMEFANAELEFLTDSARSYSLSEPHMHLSYVIGNATYQATLFQKSNGGMLRSQDRRRHELFIAFNSDATPYVLEGVPIACGGQTHDGMTVRTAWTGSCVDGLISGTGTLEFRDANGLYLWAIDVTGENGLALEGGIITVALDKSDYAFTCDEEGEDIWIQVSEVIALHYTGLANRMLAVGAGIHENDPCFVATPVMAGMAASHTVYITNYAPSFSWNLTMVEGSLRNGVPRTPKNEFYNMEKNRHASITAAEVKAAQEAERAAQRAREQAALQELRDASRAKRRGFMEQYRVEVTLEQDCDWTFNPYELEGRTVALSGFAIEMLSATSADFATGYPTTTTGIWMNQYIAGFGWCDEYVTLTDVPRSTFQSNTLYYVAGRVTGVRNGQLHVSYLGSLVCEEKECIDFRYP